MLCAERHPLPGAHCLEAIQAPCSTSATFCLQTLFLRNMLEFESEMSGKMAATSEVLILLWPSGEIVAVPRGTTAGQLERDQRWASLRGQASQQEPPPTKQFVNVNNTMVPADQELWDGDYLVVTNEILTI